MRHASGQFYGVSAPVARYIKQNAPILHHYANEVTAGRRVPSAPQRSMLTDASLHQHSAWAPSQLQMAPMPHAGHHRGHMDAWSGRGLCEREANVLRQHG